MTVSKHGNGLVYREVSMIVPYATATSGERAREEIRKLLQAILCPLSPHQRSSSTIGTACRAARANVRATSAIPFVNGWRNRSEVDR